MPASDLKVAHAKELQKRIDVRGVIVLAFDGDNFAVAEWGKDRVECARLKQLVNAIADKLASGDLPSP